MRGFPFIPEDLLSVDNFILYCKDRGVKVTRELLEKFHKLDLVSPCIRIFPGIAVFVKAKFKEYNGEVRDVNKADLSRFESPELIKNSEYYSHCPIFTNTQHGDETWLDFYYKNKGVEYPYLDTKFIPWKSFGSHKTFSRTKNIRFLNYRRLFYSKKQIFILKHILHRRSRNFCFNQVPTESVLQEVKNMVRKDLKIFDENFQQEKERFFVLFESISKLESLWKAEQKQAVEIYKDSVEESYSLREREAELGAILKQLERNEFRKRAKEIFTNRDCEFLKEGREFLIRQAFTDTTKLNTYMLVETKDGSSTFQKKGELLFMIDCMNLVRIIEWAFGLLEYGNWTSIEKTFFLDNNLKTCIVCGKFFTHQGKLHNKQTCSTSCGTQLKRQNKNLKRRKKKMV